MNLVTCHWGVVLLVLRVHSLDTGLSQLSTIEGLRGGEVCDTETMTAECDPGHVILMTSAKYGRMNLGRCVGIDLGYIGCSKDVLAVADRRCSGHRECTIRVPDAELERMRPCLKELKTFLQAYYICVPVERVDDSHCEVHSEINVTTTHGYISSTSMRDTPSCGGASHPWVIAAHPGQRINLTLLDFSLEMTYDPDAHDTLNDDVIEICHEYGILEDFSKDKTSVICGGATRVSHMYLSQGHVVKLWITNSKDDRTMKQFLIEYSVLGCPNLTPPEGAWFKRTTDGAMMGCLYSDITWTLSCENHVWAGFHGNCTHKVHAEEIDEAQQSDFPLTYGIAIAIIIGAAFGVALVIFIVGLVRYRRSQLRRACYSRDTILLRQRAEQAADRGCKQTPSHQTRLLDADPKTPSGGGGMGGGIGGGMGGGMGGMTELHLTPLCRHQHHPVRVNGNEYEHIWEAPLPLPSGLGTTISADLTCSFHHPPRHPGGGGVGVGGGQGCAYTTFKPDNFSPRPVLQGPDNKPLYLAPRDILLAGGTLGRREPLYDHGRYSALDRRARSKEAEDI